jgi:hypothetical protein
MLSLDTEEQRNSKVPVKGLRNNIYQFKNVKQINNYKTTRVEKTIDRTKQDWMKLKYKQWEE